MTEYRFRTALLRGKRAYRLDRGVLSARGRHGTQEWQLDLGRVKRAVFVDLGKASTPIRRLDLFGPEGLRRVTINSAMGGMEEDRAEFAKLAAAICREMAEAQPDAGVEVGEYGVSRLVMLGAGLLCLVGGAGILVASAAASPARIAEAALPIGALLLVGGALTWGNRPGRPRRKLSARKMAEVIEKLDRRSF